MWWTTLICSSGWQRSKISRTWSQRTFTAFILHWRWTLSGCFRKRFHSKLWLVWESFTWRSPAASCSAPSGCNTWSIATCDQLFFNSQLVLVSDADDGMLWPEGGAVLNVHSCFKSGDCARVTVSGAKEHCDEGNALRLTTAADPFL